MALWAAMLGFMLDAMDVLLYSFALQSIRAEFGLSNEQAGLVFTYTLVASAFGGIISGLLCDRFGRQRTLIFTILLYSLASAGSATSHNLPELLFWRSLVGLGLGAEWSAGAVLVAEYWPSDKRARAISLMQSGWAIGYMLAASQEPYLREVGLLHEDQHIDQMQWLLDSALTGPITFLPWSAGVMSHFEHDLYAQDLPPAEFNARWWQYVARYQGVAPPSERAATGCDACTKTHINDDPAGYYDYALANVLVYQLHDHICREILHQDPHSCNYYGHTEVGDFLRAIESPGASRDWREVLREHTGHDLTAEPMLEYYRPLLAYLQEQNAGRDCTLPE